MAINNAGCIGKENFYPVHPPKQVLTNVFLTNLHRKNLFRLNIVRRLKTIAFQSPHYS